MMYWNYHVFREDNGDYIVREVFYEADGRIVSCTENAVEPFGRSLEELTENIESFKQAVALPVLTLADVPCEPKPKYKSDKSNNISHEQLLAELGLHQAGSNSEIDLLLEGARS